MGLSIQVSALMEMQQFFPRSDFLCENYETSFDSCVLLQGLNDITCALPFQDQSLANRADLMICQNHEDGFATFKKFQAASKHCKPFCLQLAIELQYSMPQYLLAQYLWDARESAQLYAYYLHLPSTIKVSTSFPSYGFISYIAQVAGWYNLFLGGSILAFWDSIWIFSSQILSKFYVQFDLLFKIQKFIIKVLAGGILVYIFTDCISTLANTPTATSTMLTNSPNGFSISLCLPQYTSVYALNYTADYENFEDIANTATFWTTGNSLDNKIAEFSVKKNNGDWVVIWSKDLMLLSNQSEHSPFKIVNMVYNEMTVSFCHTFDLTDLPFQVSQLMINAVNDITIMFHLAGQLLKSQSYYEVANKNTVVIRNNIYIYGSEVTLQLEETSFQNIKSDQCENYNFSWTYDDCLLDYAITKLGNKQKLLNMLFRPNSSISHEGIERHVLQSLYLILNAEEIIYSCKQDCRSLVVKIFSESSPIKSSPKNGFKPAQTVSQKLPPVNINVNITLPDISKLNEVWNRKIFFSFNLVWNIQYTCNDFNPYRY
jgi:hypothetical protein